MFCRNCGLKLDDDARFCPNCGTDVLGQNAQQERTESRAQSMFRQAGQSCSHVIQTNNTMAILGFILSFFFAPAGLILSIIAYKSADKYQEPYKAFAIAGIVLSSIAIAAFIMIYVSVVCIFWYALM